MDEDADLYQATLQDYHDTLRHARPWSPDGLLLAAFFCGPIGGGALVSLNFKHLGQSRAAVWSAVGFTLLTLSLIAVTVYVLVNQMDVERRIIRFGAQLTTVAAAFGATSFQRARYRAFVGHGGEPRPLFKIGVLACIVGALIYLGLTMIAFQIAGWSPSSH